MRNSESSLPYSTLGVGSPKGMPIAPTGDPVVGPLWSDLVARVRNDEPGGLEALYRAFADGVRFYLRRRLGLQDLEDQVLEVFLIVARSIRNGDLRDPETLVGFVRTVVRQVAAQIEENVKCSTRQTDANIGVAGTDSALSPDMEAIRQQDHQIAMEVLGSISQRDSEMLVRFYLKDQSPEKICNAMGLTEAKFRLVKSQARARFGQLRLRGKRVN